MLDMTLLLAADEPSPVSVNIAPMIQTIVVFLLAFGATALYIWPKITKGLDERDAKIRSGIEAAEQARKETEAKQAEFETQLASAREEADKERAQLRTNFQQYREELKAKADEEVAKMKERALREIESAKFAAVTDLHAEAANLAANVAGKILEREINPADQEALVMESLKEMASSRG